MSKPCPKKVVRLESSDKEVFEAPECMIAMSKTIRTEINQFQDDQVVIIPLLVDSKTLAMVIEWCENHVAKSTEKQYQFVEGLHADDVLHLIITARCSLGMEEMADHLGEAIVGRALRKTRT